jgi:hydrogenase nickel incorporation protein HypA/HybF
VHEIGLCEGVVEAVERRAAGRPVQVVRLRAGAQHRVVGPAMANAFALVAAGTVAEGAELDLVVVPVQARCRGCDHRAETTDPWAVCPACGSDDLELSGGDELTLESITFTSTADAAG